MSSPLLNSLSPLDLGSYLRSPTAHLAHSLRLGASLSSPDEPSSDRLSYYVVFADFGRWRAGVARSRLVRIYVVEALLVAIYLPKKKDAYMYTRPTSPPRHLATWSLHS
jgi:hypothetical protein